MSNEGDQEGAVHGGRHRQGQPRTDMTELAVSSGRGEPLVTKLPLLRRAMVRQMVQGAAVPCFYLRLTGVRDRPQSPADLLAPPANDDQE